MTNDSHAGVAPLTPAEEAFLAAHGGFEPISDEDAAKLLQESPRSVWQPVLEGALSTEEVAEHLHVPLDKVRRLATRDALYCVQAGGVQRFPAWQFSGAEPLPHLPEVLNALQDAHPATVTGFMTLPSDELDGLSPAAWLAARRPPASVVRLAHNLFTW